MDNIQESLYGKTSSEPLAPTKALTLGSSSTKVGGSRRAGNRVGRLGCATLRSTPATEARVCRRYLRSCACRTMS